MRNWEYTPAIEWLENQVVYIDEQDPDGSIRHLAWVRNHGFPRVNPYTANMFSLKGSYDSGFPMIVTWSGVPVSSLLDVARILY